MPYYAFMCRRCGNAFEVKKEMVRAGERQGCGVCGAQNAARCWGAPPVHYKGEGFYSTDHKKESADAGST